MSYKEEYILENIKTFFIKDIKLHVYIINKDVYNIKKHLNYVYNNKHNMSFVIKSILTTRSQIIFYDIDINVFFYNIFKTICTNDILDNLIKFILYNFIINKKILTIEPYDLLRNIILYHDKYIIQEKYINENECVVCFCINKRDIVLKCCKKNICFDCVNVIIKKTIIICPHCNFLSYINEVYYYIKLIEKKKFKKHNLKNILITNLPFYNINIKKY